MINITYSINNIPIRLTDERWTHIVESHDNMAAATVVNEIFEALPHIKKTGVKHL